MIERRIRRETDADHLQFLHHHLEDEIEQLNKLRIKDLHDEECRVVRSMKTDIGAFYRYANSFRAIRNRKIGPVQINGTFTFEEKAVADQLKNQYQDDYTIPRDEDIIEDHVDFFHGR